MLLDAAYRDLKDARSLVDFADLELRARDLLLARPDLAETYRERFADVLVDEFQDTNRLQCELIDLVAGGELFFVGDEFQSIYRFRHADVSVYREQRAAAGDELIALRRNHRSRPHVIDVVNEVFSRDFGERYTPLLAEAGHPGDPPAGGRVELLLTDKAGFREAGESWRGGRGRRRWPRRIAELVDDGEARPGQIVLLFEAGTGRRPVRGRAPRAPSAHRADDRPRLLRDPAGVRPARLSAPPSQPLRRRGAPDGARLAAGRHVERRPPAASGGRR